MLHLDFIDKNIFTSCIDIGVEEERSRNRAEEEHVQKDKEDEEKLKPF